ncbi:MAG: phosphogluconate dehydrogenase (NAD(+)-dependent, decarboxylating) [Gammaproteobacteria bacterium]
MQIAMVGLGRMGSNMVRRLLRAGHQCVVYDRSAATVKALEQEGATGAASLKDLVAALKTPRAVWMMLPVAIVDSMIQELAPLLKTGDVVIDGGNSYYRDDIRRAAALAEHGLRYLDVGVSGGVWGLERGYCLMIGGDGAAVEHLTPIFSALAPGVKTAAPTPARGGKGGPATEGYLHCGPVGAGHFVKMVHNGIEYGMMAALAEGLDVLKHANVGKQGFEHDAETSPLQHPEAYQYDLDLTEITELWRRGTVISSWLLDLTADALAANPTLEGFSGRVSDSGEGRWTVLAAVESGTPAPVLTTALFERFSSRNEGRFAAQVLSAMRAGFGGHQEKPGGGG